MRRLATLVGIVVCLLGASSLLWAQSTGPITVTACAPCHGAGAAATQAAPNFPKLDGQHAAYLDKQLREYKSGKRKTGVMAPIIAALKKHQIPEMAKHFAESSRVLHRGGHYVCVVGDSVVSGTPILVHQLLPLLAEEAGLHSHGSWGYEIRNRHMRFPRMGRGGIVRYDWVLEFEKQ